MSQFPLPRSSPKEPPNLPVSNRQVPVPAPRFSKTDVINFLVEKNLLDAMQERIGAGTITADAAETVVEYNNGFAIRFCEGPRPFLNWQAGVLTTERRWLPTGKSGSFWDWSTVSLFHLLGYGTTRDEAVEMAQNNPHGRNGR